MDHTSFLLLYKSMVRQRTLKSTQILFRALIRKEI